MLKTSYANPNSNLIMFERMCQCGGQRGGRSGGLTLLRNFTIYVNFNAASIPRGSVRLCNLSPWDV